MRGRNMKIGNIEKIRVSQKINENVFIEVDDAEDFVPEIKIEFMNVDIKLNSLEKLEVGHLIKDYIINKVKNNQLSTEYALLKGLKHKF